MSCSFQPLVCLPDYELPPASLLQLDRSCFITGSTDMDHDTIREKYRYTKDISRDHSAWRHLSTLIQPAPAKLFLPQLLRNCQGQLLNSSHPATRKEYFAEFSGLNGIYTSFFCFPPLAKYIVFWELELIYLQGRKKKSFHIYWLTNYHLEEKKKKEKLSLLIDGFFALAKPWLMDSHCSLWVGCIFSQWFLFPWSKGMS